MTLTNKRTADGEIEYVNGEIGVIESIDDGENAEVRVRLDRGPIVSVQRTKWSKNEYDYEVDANTGKPIVRQREVGTFVQIPLKLAYAFTIHKSQGSEYPIVVMPVLMTHYVMLQRNLVYTGVTRAKKVLVIVGTTKALNMAVRTVKVTERNTMLAQRLNPAARNGGQAVLQ